MASEIIGLVGDSALDGLDFEAIEIAARRRALQVAARAVEHRLNADTSDYGGSTFPCSCGKVAHYAGRRSKTFQTALGEMTLERAYYHCVACQGGFCPRDQALGMKDSSLSPAVTRMLSLAAAMVSFQEADELMRELAGVPVGAKQVERTAEALGREIAKDERTVVEPSSPCATTMYLGMDGTGVPMRASELEGRQGKQPDGGSKTREVKLVAIWSAEGLDHEGTPVRDAGSITYSAAIESALAATPTRHHRTSHNAWSAKHAGVGSIELRAAWSWATVPLGSGIWPTSSFPEPSRLWISSMPRSTSRTSPRPSTAPAAISLRIGPNSGTTTWTEANSKLC